MKTDNLSADQLGWIFPQKNDDGLYVDSNNEIIKFRFLYVKDGRIPVGVGFDEQPAICPHCGAEGRWIYTWIENGEMRGAMAGCFSKMFRDKDLGEINNAIIKSRTKEAKKEALNGWDKTIIRMDTFMQQGKYDKSWCESKIREAIMSRESYLKKRRY